MFLRRCDRRKDGKVHTYWALGGILPHQRRLPSARRGLSGRTQAKPAERLGRTRPTPGSPTTTPAIALRSTATWTNLPTTKPVLVKLKGVRLERLRDFGDAWLALGLWRLVGLDVLLEQLLATRTRRRALAAGRGDSGDSPLLRAVQRIAYRTYLVSTQRLGRIAGRAHRQSLHRPALPRTRSTLAPQGGHGEASQGTLGELVRSPIRLAVVRRHQHLLRRTVPG